MTEEKDAKRRLQLKNVWQEARELIWADRRRLAVGLGLMLVNRLAGLVLPGSSKFLVDNVIGKSRVDLLLPLAAVVGAATLVQAGTSFALAQTLGVTAQRAIADMRKAVQAHVERLPVRFFDSTKTGVLISRIMTDAEGIRNLVGTGLVRLTGGFVTAGIALVVLFRTSWQLTLMMLAVLSVFGGAMAYAFRKLRPIFRERSRINADITGRLAESLGGIRVVKAYVAERSEQLVFAKGVHRLFRNIATTITGVSGITAFTTVVIGAMGVVMILVGGRAAVTQAMTLGSFLRYVLFVGLVAFPLVEIAEIGTQISEAFAGLDRIRELRHMATEGDEDRDKPGLDDVRGEVVVEDVTFSYVAGVPVLRGVSFRSPPGTTTALVGSSGSGKSTLLSLVMGFNRPDAARVHHGVRRRLRHRRGRARGEAVRRAAPADRDRARRPGGSADPDPRRGHLEPRQRKRGTDPGRAPHPAARADDVRHRAPALHDPQRQPDSRARAGRDRRARHACRADGERRALQAAPRPPAPGRGGHLHQSR
jgi:ABC-type multidrug transport system fused ATPase/permease subunit